MYLDHDKVMRARELYRLTMEDSPDCAMIKENITGRNVLVWSDLGEIAAIAELSNLVKDLADIVERQHNQLMTHRARSSERPQAGVVSPSPTLAG